MFKSKLFWTAAVAVLLLGGYALLGFVIVPKIIRSQAIAFVAKEYQRNLQIGEVTFQPFSLQLDIADVALPDQDGQTMLGCKRLFVDFEVSSLWHRAFVFKQVTLRAPQVRGVVRADGSLNFADLAPKTKPAAESKSEVPAIWITAFDVAQGSVTYADFSRAQPLLRQFAPIVFSLQDFRTTHEGGGFHLSARNQDNEQMDWRGRIALQPLIASQGSFALSNVRAAGLAELAGDVLPFVVRSGLLSLSADYRVALGPTLNAQVRIANVELADLALRARSAADDWIQLPSLALKDTRFNLQQRSVAVSAVTATGLNVQAWLARNGKVNLVEMFTQPPRHGDTATVAAQPSKPWLLHLARFNLIDANVVFEDRSGARTNRFTITPLNVEVSAVSLNMNQPLPLRLRATVNGNGLIDVTGTVTPAPLAAELAVNLAHVQLKMLQSYVSPIAAITIGGGALGVQGSVQLVSRGSATPTVAFSGDAQVDDFRSKDNALRQDFINLKKLQLKKIRFQQKPDALSIDDIVISGPYARVAIGKDKVLNVTAVLSPHETQSAKREPKTTAPTKGAVKTGAPLAIRIKEIRVDHGRLNFSDYNVQPNFAAEIQDLHGAIAALSTDAKVTAKVDLTGNLGEFSPVHIAAELQPFAFDRRSDISLSFENISLPVFNPYSGQFAGYNIAKGKLTTQLRYQLHDRKLDATHKVRIDQLEWGEATASKDAASLPVKFATALLKDRKGVINLDIPVAGSLDDPQLKIWPIVWQVITNLITKAVTAPFDLIGSMFAGAQNAQFVDFVPGDATLDAAAATRLQALARGLAEKAEIKLDVPLGVALTLDKPALLERAFQTTLSDTLHESLGDEAEQRAAPIVFSTLPAAQRIDVLKKLVKHLAGKVPPMPLAAVLPESVSRAERQAAQDAATIDFLTDQARLHIAVTDESIDTLAKERANAIQRALLTDSGLAPTQVFVAKNGKVSVKDGKVRFELGMN